MSCHGRRAAPGEGRRDPRRLPSAKPGERGAAASMLRPRPGPAAALRFALSTEGSSQPPQPSRRTPRHRPPGGTPGPLSGGCRSVGSRTDPRPPGVETNFLRPGPPAAQAARRLPLQASRGSGCRRPRPAMRAFLPAPLQPRAPGERLAVPPRLRSNKAGGREASHRGAERVGVGCESPAEAPLGRATVARRGSGDVAGGERGRKCPALGAKALSARPRCPAPPARALPGGPGGSWRRQRRRLAGAAAAWRASRSLTSVQSERLDHCQRRHVCRGSRSDARLQHQQPLVVRKRGGDWGRGW